MKLFDAKIFRVLTIGAAMTFGMAAPVLAQDSINVAMPADLNDKAAVAQTVSEIADASEELCKVRGVRSLADYYARVNEAECVQKTFTSAIEQDETGVLKASAEENHAKLIK